MATAGYLFNEKPPAGLLIAQAIGITASTYLLGGHTTTHLSELNSTMLTSPNSGQNAALSFVVVPTILKAPAPVAARQWKTMYDIAKDAGRSLILIGSTAFAYVAYNRTSSVPHAQRIANSTQRTAPRSPSNSMSPLRFSSLASCLLLSP